MISRDAVVVVPGIMGSELRIKKTGEYTWGLRSAEWYWKAWTSGDSLHALMLDENEKDGRYGRIEATRLLRFPAYAPYLRGFEPYTNLLRSLRRHTLHPDAVAEFPYDWRLPVAYNAKLLAERAQRHLSMWRNHPAHRQVTGPRGSGAEPNLVLVGHSMGGLLCRQLFAIPGGGDGVRVVVTLGTPFFGAPKAIVLLSAGRGAPLPLPRARLRALTRSLPSIYDLLPAYRCIEYAGEIRTLTISDISSLDGDPHLAKASFDWRESARSIQIPGHIQVVGTAQPTIQSVTLDSGSVRANEYSFKPGADHVIHEDCSGDGTVPRESAQLPEEKAFALAQTHGALGKSPESIVVATDALVDRTTGPWQGPGEPGIGLRIADVADSRDNLVIIATGRRSPTGVSCSVEDLRSGRQVASPLLHTWGEQLEARFTPPHPGLYRVSLTGGGSSPTSEIFMVSDQSYPSSDKA